MTKYWLALLICAITFCAGVARADGTQSYTGTLANPDNASGTFDSSDSFSLTLALSTASNVNLQTYGFGGGVNAAGSTILAGGTDPFVGLFSGTGNTLFSSTAHRWTLPITLRVARRRTAFLISVTPPAATSASRLQT